MKGNYYTYLIFSLFSCFLFTERLNAQELITNLPVFYIETEGQEPVTSKTNYIPGTIVVKSEEASEELISLIEIRGRGNSTWNMSKKPYRIKLENKNNLLDLPAKARSWVLLANYADKSLIRNALALKISEYLGMEFTPAFRFIDLVLNGEYQGNYMLTDQVEVRKNRVPVDEQESGTTNLPELSGGYLLEIDGIAFTEPNHFFTPKGLSIAIKYPKADEINDIQSDYIKNHIGEFEKRLFSNNFTDPEYGYRSLVDEKSLINWYIACELTGNSDSFWSTYLYKYRDNDRIFFGPLWDFDIAFNNDRRLGNAEKKLMRLHAHTNRTWIERIWEDEWFRSALNTRWLELVNKEQILEKLLDFISETHSMIDFSQRQNYERWKTLGQIVHQEYQVFPTFEEEINYLSEYLISRIDFLTDSFSTVDIPNDDFFVPENYYYSIRNRNSRKEITVADNSTEPEAKIYLWENDSENISQHWEFISCGDSKYQIVNRHSGLALTGNGSIKEITQTLPKWDEQKQIWSIPFVDKNEIYELYGLVNESSGLAMDNRGGGLDNGNPLIEYTNEILSNYNQQWIFEKISPIEGGTGLNLIVDKPQTLQIYPNPVQLSGIINILIPELLYEDNVLIEVLDLNGRSYFRKEYKEIRNNIIQLPVQNLTINYGLYLLRVKTKNNSDLLKLLVNN